MSSFVAHALAGYGVGRGQGRAVLVACAVFALLPDMDYALLWGAGVEIEPRLTHSIGFVTLAAGLAALVFRAVQWSSWRHAAVLCWLAGLSHLVMDWLVGVHANPLLYPITMQTFASPVGILPSAGHPDPFNPYFWRNLAIELGIVLPLLLWRSKGAIRLAGIAICTVSLAAGLSLTR